MPNIMGNGKGWEGDKWAQASGYWIKQAKNFVQNKYAKKNKLLSKSLSVKRKKEMPLSEKDSVLS